MIFAGFEPALAKEEAASGAVYTLSNAAGGNEVLAFTQGKDGTLSPAGAFATGGAGAGAGLGSQGALVMSKDGKWLLAVNAGSNDISVFAVEEDGLELVDVEPSGGVMPISVTIHKNLVYVLNAGGSGNISGFSLSKKGILSLIPNSTLPLSNGGAGAAPGPAQIEFSPDGSQLVVTEKASNLIDTYAVNKRGLAEGPSVHPSAGQTPFGFAFNRSGVLVVSEAFGGAPDASAASSYFAGNGALELISASVPTHQTAACWVVITQNGKYAYTTNTGSGSISSFEIGKEGSLTLLEAQAGFTGDGSTPIDAALTRNSRILYVLASGTDQIAAFQVGADGSLEALGSVGVPDGSVGLAAR
jgi:6-phosphogluconolactonase (cycloisomerase 2 family)